MFAFLQGRTFRALTAAAVLSTAGLACADTRNDRVANDRSTSAGARYVYLGQSPVLILETPAQDEGPYALTGNRDTVRDEYRAGQGRWIEAGQSKVFLPPTR